MIIKSILDSDLYKFSQMNAVAKLYPNAKVRYSFINRGQTLFPKGFAERLKEEINFMSSLKLGYDEEMYFKKCCPYLDPVYFDLLRGYRFDPDEVQINQLDGNLSVEIEGYWYKAILWEVPLLAIISELFYNTNISTQARADAWLKSWDIHKQKAQSFDELGVHVADFGTRRRYSFQNQCNLVEEFRKWTFFVGTSNVYLAFINNIKPIGTHAHEWFSFHAAKYGFHRANSISLGRWVDVYKGDLGIALTDTFTTDDFFKSFDMMYAKLFDGVRHDSGDPVEFGYKAIEHYKKLRIDSMTKTIVFSDGLNYNSVAKIEQEMKGKIKTSYGIGTWLTNDIPGITPLNIVIKMIAADPEGNGNWIPTIKLSDSETKHTGDKDMIDLALKTI